MKYSVVLEESSGGGFMAWVVDLPGCFARAATRAEVEAKLPTAIHEFLSWRLANGESLDLGSIDIQVVGHEVTAGDGEEGDTSVLLELDRAPLTSSDWSRIESWLTDSRRDLVGFLGKFTNEDLESLPDESPRTLQQNIYHLAFVELMYAVWTFDLHSVAGLRSFLEWTREIAAARMRHLGICQGL